MEVYSSLAPQNPTGIGTAPETPFCTQSIPASYYLLRRLMLNSALGNCCVLAERVTSLKVAGFTEPIDHYILYETDGGWSEKRGKLFDFYIYAYSHKPDYQNDLPCGLSTPDYSEVRNTMDKVADENPEFKKVLDKYGLSLLNIERIQKGYKPLNKLPTSKDVFFNDLVLWVQCFVYIVFSGFMIFGVYKWIIWIVGALQGRW
jgi:hypothetical protein